MRRDRKVVMPAKQMRTVTQRERAPVDMTMMKIELATLVDAILRVLSVQALTRMTV